MKQPISFTKMEGAGNDFVVLDNRKEDFSLEDLIEWAPRLCDRRRGIGADGLLALQPPANTQVDYTMIYRNADGSDAGMCGNGARCLALFAHTHGMGNSFSFSVHDTVYRAQVLNEDTIQLSFPQQTEVGELPSDTYSVIYQVFTGTQHIVLSIAKDRINDEKRLAQKGKQLRYDKEYQPEGTNVNFFCPLDDQTVKLRTYEKGVEDLTLACGTGAIATALAWHHKQDSQTRENRYSIEMPGGVLAVEFDYNPETQTYSSLTLEGPAHFVFEGTYVR